MYFIKHDNEGKGGIHRDSDCKMLYLLVFTSFHKCTHLTLRGNILIHNTNRYRLLL